jgi:PST family polysaccharide transporter
VAEEEQDGPRDLTSTVVRGVSLAGAGYLFAQTLNLAVYVVLARLIAPADFGAFAAATVLLGLTLLVTESGLASAVIQRRDSLEEAAATAVVATAASGMAMSLLLLAVSPLVGLFFHNGRIGALAAASSGTVFLRTVATVPDALLQRRFSFLRRLVIEPALVVAFGATAIVLAALDLGAWALVIAQYVGYAVDALLAWLLAGWRPQLRLASYRMWRELVGYGRHVFVATAVLRVGDQVGAAIVGRQLGSAPLGQYRYAGRLAGTPFSMLLAGAAYVLFPAFSHIAREEQRLQGAFLRSLRWVCVVAFPFGLVLVPLGVPTAVLVFGHLWRSAGQAAAAMCLLPAGGMLASVVSEALKAIGQPRYLTRMHLVTSSLTAVAVLCLYPFGLTAAAAGVSIGAAGGGAFAIVLMSRVGGSPLRAMVAEVAPPATAAAIAAAALVPLELLVVRADSHGELLGLALLLLEAAAGAVLYLVALRLLAPQTGRELAAAARTGVRRVTGARSRARAAAA